MAFSKRKKVPREELFAGIIIVALLVAASLVGVVSPARFLHAQQITPTCGSTLNAGYLSGYAWSDTVGWISFKGTASEGSPYGVYVDASNGQSLCGYAWNSNIGWISFNQSEVGSASSVIGKPNIKLAGWARALSAGSGSTGWDGFLYLDVPNPPGPLNAAAAIASPAGGITTLLGYGWGGEVVGWVQYSGSAQNTSPLAATLAQCNDGVDNDSDGQTDLADTGSCTAAAGGGYALADPLEGGVVPTIDEFYPDPNPIVQGNCSTLNWQTTNAASASINKGVGSVPVDGSQQVCPADTTTYTLTAHPASGSDVQQSTKVTVNEPIPDPPTIDDFTAVPASVRKGTGTTQLSWTKIAGATSCQITTSPALLGFGPDSGGSYNGTYIVSTASPDGSISATSLQAETTFTLTCTGDGGTTVKTKVVHLLPEVQEL